MSKLQLEQIFFEFMDNPEIEDNERITIANEQAINQISSQAMDCDDVYDLLTGLGYEYEKQGFINGFCHAMQMMKVVAL